MSDAFCGPSGFGPWVDGDLSPCFMEMVLFNIPNLFWYIFGTWRAIQVANTAKKRLPHSRVFDALIAFNILAALAHLTALIVHLATHTDYSFQILADFFQILSWSFASVLLVFVRSRSSGVEWQFLVFWALNSIFAIWRTKTSITGLVANPLCVNCGTNLSMSAFYWVAMGLGIAVSVQRRDSYLYIPPQPSQYYEEPFDRTPTVKQFIKDTLLVHKPLLVCSFVSAFIVAGLEMLPMFLMGRILDVANNPANAPWLSWTALMLAAAHMAVSFMQGLKGLLFDLMANWVCVILRGRVFRSVTLQDMTFIQAAQVGQLSSRLANDTAMVSGGIASQLAAGITSVALVTASMISLMTMNWRLTLVMMSLLPIAFICMVMQGRIMRRLSKAATDQVAQVSTKATEAITNIRTVRSFARESYEKVLFAREITKGFAITKEICLVDAFATTITWLCINITFVLGVWYGSQCVYRGEMSVGQLFSTLLFSLNMVMYLSSIPAVAVALSQCLGSYENIYNIMNRASTYQRLLLRPGIIPREFVNVIELKNVHFGYPIMDSSEGGPKILKGLNLTVRPGEVISLVGRSGAGKTTVFGLLTRLYEADEGYVMVSNQEVRTLDVTYLRMRLGMVKQEPALLGRTIRDNITYGIPRRVSDAEIEAAARSALAWDFIQDAGGLDTAVGSVGSTLSGGQKARVAIARVFLQNPPILLLDEATAALDTKSEELVMRALKTLMVGRTCIVIAHRESTIKAAHRICVMREGRVVEEGTFEELSSQPLSEFSAIYRTEVVRDSAATGEFYGEDDEKRAAE